MAHLATARHRSYKIHVENIEDERSDEDYTDDNTEYLNDSDE